MRIDWKEVICGVPIIRIRGSVVGALTMKFSGAHDVAKYLRIRASRARALVAELVHRGWLEKASREKLTKWRRQRRTEFYCLTMAGNSFAIARAVRRIDRSKANHRLKAFVDRINTLNADDDYGWYVFEAYVFGSYLDSSAHRLG